MTRPNDPHDAELERWTHPTDWVPPEPADRYDLVVVGGGTAGLVASIGAAGLGARVALVERAHLGGDCLVDGCVPSKAVLHPAHMVARVREASRLGIDAELRGVDFAAVMDRMRQIRARIAEHDSAERLAREGVDVFFGDARFLGPDRLQAGEVELRFRRCCLATGARPARPPIPGLDEVEVLTHKTLFDLTELPARLTVVGAGAIGCEMAQAMARLGADVTLVDQAERVLSQDDAEAAAVVQAALEADGVQLCLGAGVERFENDGSDKVTVVSGGERLVADAILLAVGRSPNVDLDLEAAGVAYDRGAVTVDERLCTTNPRIYAAGDVVGQAQFTHAAYHHARLVIGNALFFQRRRVGDLVIPHATFTDPELAAVGVTGAAAAERGWTAYRADVDDNDRGRTDGEGQGFLEVWTDGSGRIRGATLVGRHAGELLAPITVAMTHGIRLHQLATTVFPYPTRSELLFKVAGDANRARMKPWMKRASAWVLSRLRGWA